MSALPGLPPHCLTQNGFFLHAFWLSLLLGYLPGSLALSHQSSSPRLLLGADFMYEISYFHMGSKPLLILAAAALQVSHTLRSHPSSPLLDTGFLLSVQSRTWCLSIPKGPLPWFSWVKSPHTDFFPSQESGCHCRQMLLLSSQPKSSTAASQRGPVISPQHLSPRCHATVICGVSATASPAELGSVLPGGPFRTGAPPDLPNSPHHPSHLQMCSYKGPCLPEQESRLLKAQVAIFSMGSLYPPLSGSFLFSLWEYSSPCCLGKSLIYFILFVLCYVLGCP